MFELSTPILMHDPTGKSLLVRVCPNCGVSGPCSATQKVARGQVALCFECGDPVVVEDVQDGSLMLSQLSNGRTQTLGPEVVERMRFNSQAIRFLNGVQK